MFRSASSPFDFWLDRSGGFPRWSQVILAALALLLGLLIIQLPTAWAALLILIALLTVATLIDPAVGIGVAVVLGPTKPATEFFFPALPLDLGQIALIITLGAWLLHALQQRRLVLPHSPLNAPLLTFVGVSSLSLLNALSAGEALTELIKWGQLIIMMWLVVNLSEGERRQQRMWLFIGLVLAAATAQALVGVWQFGLRGDGPQHFEILGGQFYRAYGSFEQPNPYGGFLGLLLPLAIALSLAALEAWLRPLLADLQDQQPLRFQTLVAHSFTVGFLRLIAFGALAGLLLAALLMSWSRGAWIGFAAAATTLLFAWPRRWPLGALLVLVAVGLGLFSYQFGLLPAAIADRLTGFTEFIQIIDVRGVDINDANYAVIERFAHWQAATEMARSHPLIGVGIGNFNAVYPAYGLLNWPQPLGHAHNFYLNLLAEIGILGLFAYLALWAVIVALTWGVSRRSDLWTRMLAVGLLGSWAHLTVHHLVDKLYVANLHLHIGLLLGVLSCLVLMASPSAEPSLVESSESEL
ncbi:MAG: O-antigen ligase family protein [Chloroflexi bacterium]|nr:O-antigen ligase family protein [Chloroflexota bacterium]